MSTPLPGLEPPIALTDRQSLALALIRERGPISSAELGARVREHRGGRPSGEQWDVSNGEALGGWLRARGLVVKRRGLGWVVAGWTEPRMESSQLRELPEWL